jgi:hypothetical protein
MTLHHIARKHKSWEKKERELPESGSSRSPKGLPAVLDGLTLRGGAGALAVRAVVLGRGSGGGAEAVHGGGVLGVGRGAELDGLGSHEILLEVCGASLSRSVDTSIACFWACVSTPQENFFWELTGIRVRPVVLGPLVDAERATVRLRGELLLRLVAGLSSRVVHREAAERGAEEVSQVSLRAERTGAVRAGGVDDGRISGETEGEDLIVRAGAAVLPGDTLSELLTVNLNGAQRGGGNGAGTEGQTREEHD